MVKFAGGLCCGDGIGAWSRCVVEVVGVMRWLETRVFVFEPSFLSSGSESHIFYGSDRGSDWFG